MNVSKLFRVLVIGGAMMGCTEPEPSAPIPDADVFADGGDDAGEPDTETDAMADASDDAVESDAMPDAMPGDAMVGTDATLMNAGFCPNDIGCDEDGELRDGFTCCWGTSC